MQRHILASVALLSITMIVAIIAVPHVYAASYNRTAAGNYADQWAHGRNSNYPNFGTGCNCTDCQNLASQSLQAGGYPLHNGNFDKNSVTQWWYYSSMLGWQNSKTWSASDWFNTYVAQYSGDFQVNSVSSGSQLSKGDFVAIDTGSGVPDHTRVIIGPGTTSTNQADYTDGCGTNKPIPSQKTTTLGDQHCIDRWHVAWDYNLILPNGQPMNRWYIHVIW